MTGQHEQRNLDRSQVDDSAECDKGALGELVFRKDPGQQVANPCQIAARQRKPRPVDEHRLAVAIETRKLVDHRFGRSYRRGWVAICLCIHGDSVLTGHGPGILTLITGPEDALGFTLDPALVYALVRQESGFNPLAVSGAGAVWFYFHREKKQALVEEERFAQAVSTPLLEDDLRKIVEVIGERNTAPPTAAANLSRTASMIAELRPDGASTLWFVQGHPCQHDYTRTEFGAAPELLPATPDTGVVAGDTMKSGTRPVAAA